MNGSQFIAPLTSPNFPLEIGFPLTEGYEIGLDTGASPDQDPWGLGAFATGNGFGTALYVVSGEDGGFVSYNGADTVLTNSTIFQYGYGGSPTGFSQIAPCNPATDGINFFIVDAQTNNLGDTYLSGGSLEAEVTCFGNYPVLRTS